MHREDIQGLRAIAVLLVLIFHAFPHQITGGYIGVDVFFVISGYLITGIIYREFNGNKFSFFKFYSRRIKRIFPALFVMICISTFIGFAILSPKELLSFGNSAIASIFSISNIYFWRTSGYFATEASTIPLLHTWSLGVEEQFYIVLPAIMVIILKYFRKYIVAIILASIFASLIISEMVIPRSASGAYFLLPTRAFELLIGSLLATSGIKFSSQQNQLRSVAGFLGLLLIVLPSILFTESTKFPGINALFPSVGAALVILAGCCGTPVLASRLISTKFFTFFGDISYSLYLWHWPVLAYLRVMYGVELPVSLAVVAIVLSIVLAMISYRFVETPFMRVDSNPRRTIAIGSGAMVFGLIALAPIGLTNGFPDRFSAESLDLFASVDNHNPERSRCHSDNREMIGYAKNCIFGDQPLEKIIAVWGDSHGAELAYALGQDAEKLGQNVMEITASSCPPIQNYTPPQRLLCPGHNKKTLDSIVEDARIETVILAADGAGADTSNIQRMTAGLEQTIRQLRAADKKILLVSQIPYFTSDPPTTLGYASSKKESLTEYGISTSQYEMQSQLWNKNIQKIADDYEIKLIKPEDFLCSDGFCPMYKEEVGPLYFNRSHISLHGANLLVSGIESSIIH